MGKEIKIKYVENPKFTGIPDYILSLIRLGELKELYSYENYPFDRSQLRMFKLKNAESFCVLIDTNNKSVCWTDQHLQTVPFENIFDELTEDGREFVIFNIDKFNEEI